MARYNYFVGGFGDFYSEWHRNKCNDIAYIDIDSINNKEHRISNIKYKKVQNNKGYNSVIKSKKCILFCCIFSKKMLCS